MLKGFKEFIMRGNIVELAVAVVVGTAFTAMVTAVTNGVLKPLINSIGSDRAQGIGFSIVTGSPSTYVDLAGVINAVVNFLLVAAVVYFLIVLPMKKFLEKRSPSSTKATNSPTEIELLTEIRDLLRDQQR